MKYKLVNVIICEDNKNISALIINEIENTGINFSYKVFDKFKLFKNYLTENEVDLVISDFDMPSFSAFDVLKHLREKDISIPVIVVSGNNDKAIAEKCFNSGVEAFVNKEKIHQLSYAIQKLLCQERLTQNDEVLPPFFCNSMFKLVFNSVKEGAFLCDIVDFTLIEVNKRVEQIYGYSKKELLNLTIFDLGTTIVDKGTEKVRQFVDEAKIGEELNQEWLAKEKNGHETWVSVCFKKLRFVNREVILGMVRSIEQKKITDASLQKINEQFETLTRYTPDIIMRFDKECRHIYVNGNVSGTFGIEPELFLNKTHAEMGVFDHEMCIFWEEQIKKVYISGKPEKVEFLLKLKNVRMEIEWRLFPEFDLKNKVDTVLAIARDISDRKHQEKIQQVLFEIANSVNSASDLNELFHIIQESLNNVIDTKNCYVALYDDKTDIISLPFHKDEKDSFQEFPAGKTLTAYAIKSGVSQLVDLKRIEELERCGEIEDYGSPSLYWLGVPLKIAEKIIGVFVVQSYDESVKYTKEDVKILEFVSDQIARTIERKIDQDKLKTNEMRQRRIFGSLPDGLVTIDINGELFYFNKSFSELLGINDKKQLKGNNFFDFISKNDVAKVRNILQETLVTGLSENVEFRMLKTDGIAFFAGGSFGLIAGKGEFEENFVIVLKNITERKVYERTLKIAKLKAEESDRLKSAFLSNMSHEIRTPMNAIIGFADLLSATDAQGEERDEFIKQINQAADNLMNIIDDIIDISKIEAGEMKINVSEFGLQGLLNDMLELFKKSAKRQDKSELCIELDNNAYNPVMHIITDEFRLRQIFSNLLSNAIKFTSEGEISFGIKTQSENNIEFYVKDSGIGISSLKQSIIFDRFRQGHENKKYFYGGTGLGLSISKHLIEKMGGKIKVISQENIGSEFIFSLPLIKNDNNLKSFCESSENLNENWSGKTILIAEDEESNFLLLNEYLKDTGASLLRAKDGREVVSIFKQNDKIDLILMDIQMPVLNGYEASREIKKINSDVPIIAQTAYAMAGERDLSIEYGCSDYISKPIRAKDLISLINKYLPS